MSNLFSEQSCFRSFVESCISGFETKCQTILEQASGVSWETFLDAKKRILYQDDLNDDHFDIPLDKSIKIMRKAMLARFPDFVFGERQQETVPPEVEPTSTLYGWDLRKEFFKFFHCKETLATKSVYEKSADGTLNPITYRVECHQEGIEEKWVIVKTFSDGTSEMVQSFSDRYYAMKAFDGLVSDV